MTAELARHAHGHRSATQLHRGSFLRPGRPAQPRTTSTCWDPSWADRSGSTRPRTASGFRLMRANPRSAAPSSSSTASCVQRRHALHPEDPAAPQGRSVRIAISHRRITQGQYESSTVFEEYQVGYGPPCRLTLPANSRWAAAPAALGSGHERADRAARGMLSCPAARRRRCRRARVVCSHIESSIVASLRIDWISVAPRKSALYHVVP